MLWLGFEDFCKFWQMYGDLVEIVREFWKMCGDLRRFVEICWDLWLFVVNVGGFRESFVGFWRRWENFGDFW